VWEAVSALLSRIFSLIFLGSFSSLLLKGPGQEMDFKKFDNNAQLWAKKERRQVLNFSNPPLT
jgi:hypothetical protein